jgi:triosephosphate isomerase
MGEGRTPFVCGNWKMHKTVNESLELATAIRNAVGPVRDVEVAIAPVFTSLYAVAKRLEGSAVGVAGQNCHFEKQGAFTGELSAEMLKDVGCSHVIIGHSERRQFFGETDEGVNKKTHAALRAGLKPIVCVGESERERDAGETFGRVRAQVVNGLAGLGAESVPSLTVAYEPVWAIGTGRTATPQQAEEVHAFIRGLLGEQFGAGAAKIRIQYGGSVKPDNAAALLGQPNIDGALVGGASLKADDFLKIVKYRQA